MDCFNHNCPFRVNETSLYNKCDSIACPNRYNYDFFITSNRTLTSDELMELVEQRNNVKIVKLKMDVRKNFND